MMRCKFITKTNLFLAVSVGAALSFFVTQGLSNARAGTGFVACMDEVADYKHEVEKRMKKSKDLDDAMGCTEQ